jgi:UrcA family protein
MFRLIKYASVVGILGCTPGAVAENPFAGSITTAIAVPYGDLDLTGSDGVSILLRRVRAAGAKVCGAPPPPFNHELARLNARCRYVAAVNGLHQLGNPEVMTAFEKQTGHASIYASR